MSVIIKGMDMPKAGTTITICELEGQLYASVRGTELSPLVEVPTPHGRLIDADAFDSRVREAGGMVEEELTADFKDGVQATLWILKQVPTVIEAEE